MSKAFTELELAKAKGKESVCIGIVAKNLGHADQSKVCAAGRELFRYIQGLSERDFLAIKSLSQNK
jgi:hypothetical protein